MYRLSKGKKLDFFDIHFGFLFKKNGVTENSSQEQGNYKEKNQHEHLYSRSVFVCFLHCRYHGDFVHVHQQWIGEAVERLQRVDLSRF